MSPEVSDYLWHLFVIGVILFLCRRDIAEEWRSLNPRPPRLPPPAGGHWRFRHGR